MRARTTMVVVATAGALTLSACGGSGSDSTPSSTQDNSKLGDTGNNQDPTARGPVTLAGAQRGGIVTVLTLTGLTSTLDPSEIYYTDTNAIMAGPGAPAPTADQDNPHNQ